MTDSGNHLDLDKHFFDVKKRIEKALRDNNTCQHVDLLAVSKRKSSEAIRNLYKLGQMDFAESYVSEALQKIRELQDLDICWHFIGPVQSNKTAEIAANFNWVHSVDRSKIIQRLDKQRPPSLPPLNICLQVKLGEEKSKSGVDEAGLETLALECEQAERLKLRGLMCIPPKSDTVAEQRAWFARLRQLKDMLNQKGHKLDTLSMGMSGDLEAAIAEGATIVRIGTALFGART